MKNNYGLILFAILIFSFLLSSCTKTNWTPFSAPHKFTVKENQTDLIHVNITQGNWENYTASVSHGRLNLRTTSSFSTVSYSVDIGLENIEKATDEKIKSISLLRAQGLDKLPDINNMQEYSTKELEETGVISVTGRTTEMGGFKCHEIEEVQSYGPAPSDPKWGHTHRTILASFTKCPLVINREIWQLYSSYRISIPTNEFNNAYKGNPPPLIEIKEDLRSRLQPILESIVVLGNPTQTLPEGYR